MPNKESSKSNEAAQAPTTTTPDGSTPSSLPVSRGRTARKTYKILSFVVALGLALIGLAADLSELLGQSVVRSVLTPIAEHPTLVAFVVIAIAGVVVGFVHLRRRAITAHKETGRAEQQLTAAEQRIEDLRAEAARSSQKATQLTEKNKRLAAELQQVTANAWDMLNNRVKRDDVTAVESRVHYAILNERGDCEVYKRLVVRTNGSPCRSIEWYVASNKGKTSKEDFYASLQARGVTVEPIDDLAIGDYEIFLFRLNFDHAFSTSPVEFILRYRVNAWFPLEKEGELGIHTLMPTDSTGCRIELPEGWEIAQKWTTWEEILHPPQLMEDKYFRPINKDGFEWQLEHPKPHGYYKVRFTTRRKPETTMEAS